MTKEIIINSTNEETRIAILEESKLVELFVERPEYERMVGDIYKAKISRILPGMQAAFIDIGHEQNAFLHFSDVSSSYQEYFVDFDEDETEPSEKPRNRRPQPKNAEAILNKGEDILVQIIKEPIGKKGCRVTTDIALPGRFVVLVPGKSYVGISRKITNPKERRRLKDLAKKIIPENYGIIIRTVANERSEKELKNDMAKLLGTWKKLERKIKAQEGPVLIYKDMAMASSIIRDLFTADVEKVVVDSRKLMREIENYVNVVAPQLAHKVTYHKSRVPIFDAFKIEQEIEQIGESKVWLRNGGYLIIQPTEALVSIDVNSGKFIGKKDHETNSMRINMEAAREIARQARLRDFGGLIVIDFIDVLEDENKRKVFMELKKEFAKDRSITKIADMSRFGLIEMTRQRVRPSILHTINDNCPVCHGSGLVPTMNTIVARLERWIQRYRSGRGDRRITIRLTEDVQHYLTQGRYNRRLRLMWKYWMKIKLITDTSLAMGTFRVFDRNNEKEIELQN